MSVATPQLQDIWSRSQNLEDLHVRIVCVYIYIYIYTHTYVCYIYIYICMYIEREIHIHMLYYTLWCNKDSWSRSQNLEDLISKKEMKKRNERNGLRDNT